MRGKAPAGWYPLQAIDRVQPGLNCIGSPGSRALSPRAPLVPERNAAHSCIGLWEPVRRSERPASAWVSPSGYSPRGRCTPSLCGRRAFSSAPGAVYAVGGKSQDNVVSDGVFPTLRLSTTLALADLSGRSAPGPGLSGPFVPRIVVGALPSQRLKTLDHPCPDDHRDSLARGQNRSYLSAWRKP
jgi:hypothetical protein